MNRACGNCGYKGEGFKRGELLVVADDGMKIYETICPNCHRHYSMASIGMWGF